ncbi:MAG TPA: hypothetical protein VGK73_22675 [Polyangiaceae bacterium]
MSYFDPLARLGTYVERTPAPAEPQVDDPSRWAIALAQAVPGVLSQRFGIAPESSESWQGGVGSLTQPEAAQTGESAPSSGPKGLMIRMDAGDLGEVKCWLERGEHGMRVVLGVDGRNALAAAGAERAALEASLKTAGLPVQSVKVVPLAELGTVLAQGERAPAGRHVPRPFAGSRDASRTTRRVKWIG